MEWLGFGVVDKTRLNKNILESHRPQPVFLVQSHNKVFYNFQFLNTSTIICLYRYVSYLQVHKTKVLIQDVIVQQFTL